MCKLILLRIDLPQPVLPMRYGDGYKYHYVLQISLLHKSSSARTTAYFVCPVTAVIPHVAEDESVVSQTYTVCALEVIIETYWKNAEKKLARKNHLENEEGGRTNCNSEKEATPDACYCEPQELQYGYPGHESATWKQITQSESIFKNRKCLFATFV